MSWPEVLWGESPPASAPKIVQGCIARLRRLLGPSTIETTPTGYRLSTSGVELDTDRFVRLLTDAREQRADGLVEEAISGIEQALALWRGQPYAEIEGWAPSQHEAARLEELRLVAQEDLLELRTDLGDHDGVAADAVVLVGEEPWRERRWVLLALAQYRCARQADALTTIRRCVNTLLGELGVDPGQELTVLERSVLRHDPVLLERSPGPGPHGNSCPFKGLAPYGPDDAALSFGREGIVAALADRLETVPLFW